LRGISVMSVGPGDRAPALQRRSVNQSWPARGRGYDVDDARRQYPLRAGATAALDGGGGRGLIGNIGFPPCASRPPLWRFCPHLRHVTRVMHWSAL
jgi:hypothetical protein